MEQRSNSELLAWFRAVGHPAAALEPLAGDVSRRGYFRVRHHTGATSVLAVYPPEMRSTCKRFAHTARLLEQAGVRVPRVLLNDCSRGLMLVEDVGNKTLYDLEPASWSELGPWIERAASLLEAVAAIPPHAVAHLNPPLDGALLRRELDQTWTMLLDVHDLGGRGAVRERLRSALAAICAHLDSGPRIVCHRDFMARNLVPSSDGALVVLDHQDLRLGPLRYDLASLLNDSLFAPPELEGRLLDRLVGDEEADRRDYRRCVVQRTLKAAGTFAAFAHRGSRRHLGLIRPLLERAARHLAALPEGEDLDHELFARWRSFRPPR